MDQLTANLIASVPILVLLLGGLVLMLMDAFKLHRWLGGVAAGSLLLSIVLALPVPGFPQGATEASFFSGMIRMGGFASLVHIFLSLSAVFALFFVRPYLERMGKHISEVYSLLLFAVIGMILLANSADLIILFIGLEMMSLCLYILAALFKGDIRSNEAGLKYFLLGAFASGFLLYGIALLYGLAQSTQLDAIRSAIFTADPTASITTNLMFLPAVALILIGVLFKLAAFPFHSWTPDVYTGSPTPLAGFMATGSKMAAFIALSFFVLKAIPSGDIPAEAGSSLLPQVSNKLVNFLGIIALASMLYGNIVAVQQTNLKRLLAYSSIAHTGYVLLGILAGPDGFMSVVFYMLIYTMMTLGAFGIVSMVEHRGGGTDLADWRGLGYRRPLLGIVMAVFLFSLAGIPPLGGFIGKYLVFGAAIKAGIAQSSSYLIFLAVAGILASVIGVFYYLRVLVAMYFRDPEDVPEGTAGSLAGGGTSAGLSLPLMGALVLGSLLLILGIFPSLVFDLVESLYGAAGHLTLPYQ